MPEGHKNSLSISIVSMTSSSVYTPILHQRTWVSASELSHRQLVRKATKCHAHIKHAIHFQVTVFPPVFTVTAIYIVGSVVCWCIWSPRTVSNRFLLSLSGYDRAQSSKTPLAGSRCIHIFQTQLRQNGILEAFQVLTYRSLSKNFHRQQ